MLCYYILFKLLAPSHLIYALLVASPHPSRVPLDLLSFPPRRSSDLPLEPAGADGPRAADPGSSDPDAAAERSEEHTSELQSRGHIVCRLLLQKKKIHQQRDDPGYQTPVEKKPHPHCACRNQYLAVYH